jgi:acetyl-CoA carboxylase carboxyltransferase component
MVDLLRAIFDADSVFQIKELFAREVITAFARLEGTPVGIVASQPSHLGGVLFVDSADKASRFMWLCDAFNIPLIFLADVPGFMIGTEVERQGIIRAGAKMLTAIAEATVPRISVIVRKAYGAGLYAFSGPGFRPDATLALPTAEIAVMGPEAAVNAVYFNRIQELAEEDREAFIAARRAEYSEDVDLLRLASEVVVDAVVAPEELRGELTRRLEYARRKNRSFSERRHGVPPV